LHPAGADAALDEAREDVGVLASRPHHGGAFASGSAEKGRLLEEFVGHQRLVDWFVGPDPVGLVVPAHLRLVAEGDVLDVDEDLVATLPVPDLTAGVARVVEDGPHGTLAPRALRRRAVAVALGVMTRRRQDAVPGEALRDGEDPAPLTYSVKMRSTTGAATGSGTRR
jgi:hypothetical protein